MIYHLATQEDWAIAQTNGYYKTSNFDLEGFIHCSTALQVRSVANARFLNRPDMLLLVINPDLLTAPIQFDPNQAPDGIIDHFPHIYGAINFEAIVQATALTPNVDGTFTLPL